MESLSLLERYTLSDGSGCPIIIRENAFGDLRTQVVRDVLKMREIDSKQPDCSKQLFQLAGIGSSEATNTTNVAVRGDYRCWLLPSTCAEHQLHGAQELIKRITRLCSNKELKKSLRLNGDYSVQVTLYPGDGAHYVRHIDTGSAPAGTGNSGAGTQESKSSSRHRGSRKLTFIYYLNPLSNEGALSSGQQGTSGAAETAAAAGDAASIGAVEAAGGQLRVYNIPTCTSASNGSSNTSSSNNSNSNNSSNNSNGACIGNGEGTTTHMDIDPTLDKLVIFRSDKVEHEVLPTYRDRWAVTVWAYADDCDSSVCSSSNSNNDCTSNSSEGPQCDSSPTEPGKAGQQCLPVKAAAGQATTRIAQSTHTAAVTPVSVCSTANNIPTTSSVSSGGGDMSALLALLQPQWREDSSSPAPLQAQSRALAAALPGPPPLTIRSTTTHSTATTTVTPNTSTSSIFVSIVSYRDSELPHTVADLLSTAADPTRVYVGIVYQIDAAVDAHHCVLRADQLSHLDHLHSDCSGSCGNASSVSNSVSDTKSNIGTHSSTIHSIIDHCSGDYYSRHVRILTLPHTEAKGPIFARSLATTLYRGEQYVLQTDSHMRFRRGWDAYLIDTLISIPHSVSCKPVLTTYPQGYTLPNCVPQDTRPTVLMPSRWDENGFLRQEGKLLHHAQHQQEQQTYCQPLLLRSPLWAAGFSFCTGEVLTEVPYCPLLPHLFFGEELSMAARLYTHGYDFFAPPETVCCHLYSRAHRPTFQELRGAPVTALRSGVSSSNVTTSTGARASAPLATAVAADLIAAEKAQSLCLLQRLLYLPVSTEHQHLCNTTQFARLQQAHERAYGLGTVRSLLDFKNMLSEVGVAFPSLRTSSANTSGNTCNDYNNGKDTAKHTTVGTVAVDPAQRLNFVCGGVPPSTAGLSFVTPTTTISSTTSNTTGNTTSNSCSSNSSGVVTSVEAQVQVPDIEACAKPAAPAPAPVVGVSNNNANSSNSNRSSQPAVDLSKLLGASEALQRIQQFL